MVVPKPWLKFTVKEYMTTPEDKRYQILDGEMIPAPSPVTGHQTIVGRLLFSVYQFVNEHRLGRVWSAPLDVILSNYDVTQPDILFVSNARAGIVTRANIQGAPDLVVEVLSPATVQYDRGYKELLYGRHGVLEYWLVDPDAETVEVQVAGDQGLQSHAILHRGDRLTSPLLEGFSIDLEETFTQE